DLLTHEKWRPFGGVVLTGERGLTCSGFMATNDHRLLCGFHFFSSRCFRLPMDVPLSRLTGQLHKIVADSANSKREESEHGIESLLRPSVLQHSMALSNALLLAPHHDWRNWHPYVCGYSNNLLNNGNPQIELKDYGGKPFVVDIERAAKQNKNYRTALWTGKHLQVTLMSIEVGGDIGLEVHPDVDQFIRIEQGQGLVKMGDRKDHLDFQKEVFDDYAIMIPAGKW